LPHLVGIEKAGIPSVFIIYGDQAEAFRQAATLNGIPGLRTVFVSRTIDGPTDAERMMPELMDALTRPLTDFEKSGGTWSEPDQRILFEGTLEEAEEFYSQVEIIPQLGNAPFAKYTDGLPIVIPTEERVAKMLTGTSHKPDEVLRFQDDYDLDSRQLQMGRSGKKGDVCRFLPMARTATVEKIATIGVMAGCKPEHMPILLAMAEAGGGCGDGRGVGAQAISGPITKEVGMNFDVNVLGPGNPSNVALGRAAHLMFRNLGGNIPGVTNVGVHGLGGVQGGALYNLIPENADALPEGWAGLNEECGFQKNESCIMQLSAGWSGSQFSPGGYRAFQKSGHGGIARRLDVKGKPGPHNWLEYLVPSFWRGSEGGISFIMMPEMAQHLRDYGFKTKEEVYEWLYKKSFMTVAEYRTHSWPDVWTNAWRGIEPTSGKRWLELDEDYMVPAMSDPFQCCIIVTGGGEESSMWAGGRAGNGFGYGIDYWR
jgi:hypothetical protein